MSRRSRCISLGLLATLYFAPGCVELTEDRFFPCETSEDCIEGYECLRTNIGRICYPPEGTERTAELPDAGNGRTPEDTTGPKPDPGPRGDDPGAQPPEDTCQPTPCNELPCGADDGCGQTCPPCAGPSTCQEIKEAEPQTLSGSYVIHPKGLGTPMHVFCDMQGSKGWTRIAWLAADRPICAYSAAMGKSEDLLDEKPNTSVILSVKLAEKFFIEGEILLTFADGQRYLFRSDHLDWEWESVAGGKINSSNSGSFDIEGSLNGSPYYALETAHPGSDHANLLGGMHEAGEGGGFPGGMAHSPFLGLGAFNTGTFEQSTCPVESYKGLLFKKWGTAGAISLR